MFGTVSVFNQIPFPRRNYFRSPNALVNTSGDLRDLPTVLYVPILNPCMATEKLCVAVNIQTGNFMVSLGGKGGLHNYTIIQCPFRLNFKHLTNTTFRLVFCRNRIDRGN